MNVAVCPAVTVWLTGCAVIEGITGGGLFVAATFPVHPAFTNPIAKSKQSETTPTRFIITSLFLVFSAGGNRSEDDDWSCVQTGHRNSPVVWAQLQILSIRHANDLVCRRPKNGVRPYLPLSTGRHS